MKTISFGLLLFLISLKSYAGFEFSTPSIKISVETQDGKPVQGALFRVSIGYVKKAFRPLGNYLFDSGPLLRWESVTQYHQEIISDTNGESSFLPYSFSNHSFSSKDPYLSLELSRLKANCKTRDVLINAYNQRLGENVRVCNLYYNSNHLETELHCIIKENYDDLMSRKKYIEANCPL